MADRTLLLTKNQERRTTNQERRTKNVPPLPEFSLTSSTDSLASTVRRAVSEALGNPSGFTLLHGPHIPPTAWDYVKDCLDTGWVSSAGAYVTRFEEALAGYTGCRRAVVTVNGTAALQVALFLAGVRPGDEVIAPSLTFVATANAISHCGAVPHFVDVNESRLSIDPDALQERLENIAEPAADGVRNRQSGRRIAAVCPMHCFGHPAELDRIVEICDRWGLALVEDAAESLGSTYRGRHTGTFGLVSAVSFNGNKILTTGGGGAILTDDETLADRAKHLTTTGKVPHAWEFHHDVVAWNYRMPNLNAALGLAQLEMLPRLLAAKRALAERYRSLFHEIAGVRWLAEPEESRSNQWLQCLLLDEPDMAVRDAVLGELNGAGLQSRPVWEPMHRLPMYRDAPRGPMAVTESIYRRAINVPSSAELAPGWPDAFAEDRRAGDRLEGDKT